MAERVAFQFEGGLAYQQEAVSSVVDLFRGSTRLEESTLYRRKASLHRVVGDAADNPPIVPKTRLLKNLREIQLRNRLFPDPALSCNHFTVEMETGTGKTYVYLRSILELHRTYGFIKFMIVVPSIAIRKGVEKSIEMLREHVKELYDGLDLRNHAFVYDSGSLQTINRFVETSELCIAVMNIQAFNKETNRLRQPDESGQILWDDIRQIRPIVILDEPQRMEGTAKKTSASLEAIERIDPLFVVRYSATHKRKYHQVYQLDSFDAYRNDLVKKIVVKTVQSAVPKHDPYIRYVEFTKDLFARIEIFHLEQGGSIRTKTFLVRQGADLYELSGRLPQYRNMLLLEDPHEQKKLTFRTEEGEIELGEGEAHSGADASSTLRIQIRLAIQTHLEKQLKILRHGYKIKVLTLFFIDAVRSFRDPSKGDGRGEILRLFDEEYAALISDPRWNELFQQFPELFAQYREIPKVREGYFAVDRHRNAVEIDEWNSVSDEPKLKVKAQEDVDRGIELILEKKDELISFNEPLAFIFSHSALREGWDNPNVFTLCTLKRGGSAIAKKQEIGRGMRLPVDIYGNRSTDPEINELTVIANDSYDHFAASLQRDFNKQAGLHEDDVTKKIPIKNGDVEEVPAAVSSNRKCKARFRSEPIRRVQIDHEAFFQACAAELNETLGCIKQADREITIQTAKAYVTDQKKLALAPAAEPQLLTEAIEDMESAAPPKSDVEIMNYIMYHTLLPRLAIYRIISKLDRIDLLRNQNSLDLAVQRVKAMLILFKARGEIR